MIDKVVTKEIFKHGCRFYHINDYRSFISEHSRKKDDKEPMMLTHLDGSYFANISKIDKSGFNLYYYLFGKYFCARVLFKDLILMEIKEGSND